MSLKQRPGFRHTALGIIIILLGVLIAAMAPVTRWVITPQLARIPNGIKLDSILEGKATFYIDPTTSQSLGYANALELPLVIDGRGEGIPRMSNWDVVVVKTEVDLKAPDQETYQQHKDLYEKFKFPTEYYAIDRKTGENVSGHNSDIARTGNFSVLQIGTEKRTYEMWDGGIGGTIDLRYIGEEKLDGNKRKGMTVYVFKAETGLLKLETPPGGFPGEISLKDNGAIISKAAGTAVLPQNQDLTIQLDYLKRMSMTVKVEPRTGMIVDTSSHTEKFFIDTEKYGISPNVAVLDIEYETPDNEIIKGLDNATKFFWQLDLGLLWMPLFFLLLGSFILLLGIMILVKKRRVGVRESRWTNYRASFLHPFAHHKSISPKTS